MPEHLVDERDGVGAADRFVLVDVGGGQAHVLGERWQLGAPLTARDAAAPNLAPVLSLDTPRDPGDWPDVTPRPVPAFSPARVPLEARLKGLCKAACFPVLVLAKDMGLPAPDINQDEAIGRADAIALIDEVFGHMFPGLHAD